LGFAAYQLGEKADAAVIQADHAEYRTLKPSDIPGVKALVDGRRVTDPELWSGVAYRVIGGGGKPSSPKG
jgi:UDP-N-acetyl-D-mannosaminuronate dehydrogenase